METAQREAELATVLQEYETNAEIAQLERAVIEAATAYWKVKRASTYLTHPASTAQNEGDRPDDDNDDEELDQLVRKIFEIIPSYYHEGEAAKIKRLITDYVRRRTVTRRIE